MALTGGQILAQSCCCPRCRGGGEDFQRPQKTGGRGGDTSSAKSPTCISWLLLLSRRGEEAKVII